MSVIVALISSADGVVSSDGRLFDSAWLDNGQVTKPALISSESFDKTFVIYDGKAIGAFSGLMHFSGKTVADHISEIAVSHTSFGISLTALAETVREEMRDRLWEIDPEEVVFACRTLDILLVGGRNLTRAEVGIISIRFSARRDAIISEEDIVWADRGNRYYVRGEDRAIRAAARVFETNRAPNRDIKFLKKLARQAVRAGISAAGTPPHGSDLACGGKVFTKQTRYL